MERNLSVVRKEQKGVLEEINFITGAMIPALKRIGGQAYIGLWYIQDDVEEYADLSADLTKRIKTLERLKQEEENILHDCKKLYNQILEQSAIMEDAANALRNAYMPTVCETLANMRDDAEIEMYNADVKLTYLIGNEKIDFSKID